jgi:DNA-directed RNA polymerase subunit F
MSGQEEFDSVMDNDEYIQQLAYRLQEEKVAMVGTLAALAKRIIQISPREKGEVVIPQNVLLSLTQHLEIELCLRSMDEIDPNWKMKAMEELASDPNRMEQLLNDIGGVLPSEVKDDIRASCGGVKPTFH